MVKGAFDAIGSGLKASCKAKAIATFGDFEETLKGG
jgi:hypothetical protein